MGRQTGLAAAGMVLAAIMGWKLNGDGEGGEDCWRRWPGESGGAEESGASRPGESGTGRCSMPRPWASVGVGGRTPGGWGGMVRGIDMLILKVDRGVGRERSR